MAKKSSPTEPKAEEKIVAPEDKGEQSLKTLNEILKMFCHLSNELVEAVWLLKRESKDLRDFIEEVSKTNANVDETLGNVLLAIRQNEYLQAHYPAQQGYPEMKVVGKHPLNIKAKGKK